jgi:hypothetical protein
MALLPLQRKSCYGFLLPLKIHHPWVGLNPQTLGPIASTITIRPLRVTVMEVSTITVSSSVITRLPVYLGYWYFSSILLLSASRTQV